MQLTYLGQRQINALITNVSSLWLFCSMCINKWDQWRAFDAVCFVAAGDNVQFGFWHLCFLTDSKRRPATCCTLKQIFYLCRLFHCAQRFPSSYQACLMNRKSMCKSIKTNSKLLFPDQADIPVDSWSKFDIKAFAVLFVYFIKLHTDIKVVKNVVELLILNLKCSKRRETQSLPLTEGKHW